MATARGARGARPQRRSDWMREGLARDIFTALVVDSAHRPAGQGITLEQQLTDLADQALRAADVFDKQRRSYKEK